VGSRLALDKYGRLVAITTDGRVWLVVDLCDLGWFTPRGRRPTARERASAKAPYMQPKRTGVWPNYPREPELEELDEKDAIKAAYAEQRRKPVDLVNVAA
jgi:hypothetical protein